jgi:predicted NBD/HSP70 family sugar kinase
VTRALPQSILREATDSRLFAEVLARGRATRAELATATSISKPTASEAVRRLVGRGLLDGTGPQETGRRGRIGTFYELGASAGWVLAIELNQSGVRARTADLSGRMLHEYEKPPGAVVNALRTVARAAIRDTVNGPLRTIAVSIANPVHPTTHEVIALPGSPFPEGILSPAKVLARFAPVLVDNDVNLAALAEHRAGAAAGAASFAYLYVGAGLGLGLYIGDQLIRGAHGLAGEIGYLPGAGPRTLATDLTAGGLGRSDSPANDVSAIIRLLDGGHRRTLKALSEAIVRAVASVNAVIDPELVLLGGPVGTHPALLPAVRAACAGPTRIEHGTLGALASLRGTTHLALEHARTAALAGST